MPKDNRQLDGRGEGGPDGSVCGEGGGGGGGEKPDFHPHLDVFHTVLFQRESVIWCKLALE